MLLVVFGHNWIVLHDSGELFRIIFSFHMPLFFFLAGVFLKDSMALKELAASKTDAILKPYFCVMAALGSILIIYQQTPPLAYLAEVLYGTGDAIALATGDTIAMVPIWFLPHLFITTLFAQATLRFMRKLGLSGVLIVLFLFMLIFCGSLLIGAFRQQWVPLYGGAFGMGGTEMLVRGLPFSVDLVPVTAAFMLSGFFLGPKVKSLRARATSVLVAILLFSALHYIFNETIDLNSRLYGDPVIASLQAICGIYIILSLSALIPQASAAARSLAMIGSGSLFILIFHQAIQNKAFAHLTRISEMAYLNGLVAFLLGVGGPLILLVLVKRQAWLAKCLLPSP